jgi:hypothetical protein
MEVSAHRVTNVRVKVTIHDNFAVKEISFVDGNGNEMNIKMFGKDRNDLRFMISETIDARGNALC